MSYSDFGTFFGFQWYLAAGVWVVYKFMFPIMKGIKPPKTKEVGRYKTMTEARNETLKPLTRDHGFSPEPSWEEDAHGKYWKIEILTTAFKIIFVPVREDFFDKK